MAAYLTATLAATVSLTVFAFLQHLFGFNSDYYAPVHFGNPAEVSKILAIDFALFGVTTLIGAFAPYMMIYGLATHRTYSGQRLFFVIGGMITGLILSCGYADVMAAFAGEMRHTPPYSETFEFLYDALSFSISGAAGGYVAYKIAVRRYVAFASKWRVVSSN
ncbi:MAG: hypothetical protein P4M15_02670 [Alphaproteobacteria bacterium]|nr:hypothetical protein [Alphaproteobacteria bacterium]